MVDVWLLFNLLYPFVVVIMHTYMDSLRNDEDREINHHGKTMQIDEDGKAIEKGQDIVMVRQMLQIAGSTTLT